MERSDVARLLGASRVVVGAALTAAPGSGAGWIGPAAGEGPTSVFTRGLGARDAALGLGALRCAGDADALRPWLAAGVIADAADCAATMAARDELPPLGRYAAPAIAGAAALLGIWLLAKSG